MEPSSNRQTVEIGFTQSLIDDCVFYCGDNIFIVYVDDGIFIGDTDNQILAIIAQLQGLGLTIEDRVTQQTMWESTSND